MVAFQQSHVELPDIAAFAPLSWEGVKDSYYLFFMTDTTAAVCLAAYVVITLLLIVFLVQPKAARTLVRPGRPEKGHSAPALSSQAQIADICGTPVIPVGSPGRVSHIETRQQSTVAPKTMPASAKHDRVTVQPAPVARQSAAVLYITDNDSSEHLQDSLGAAGMAVISSPPGKDAVHNITVTKFDTIVIDTLVAEAARLCATRILEALPPKPRMPVLIIVNHPGQTLNIAATNARIDYIFRPFDDGFLVAKVGLMLAQKDREPNPSAEQTATQSLPYDKQMEKLVESLPAVADGIQQKSEHKSLSNIELHSGVISALGEDAAAALGETLKSEETPLADEIKKTAEQVDELLRLCASVKPPKPQN
jgi:DNA-binding response OmpR family regulator